MSLSKFGIEIAQEAFNVIPEKRDRRKLAKILQEHYSSKVYPRYNFPEHYMKEIAERHRHVNELLTKEKKFPDEMSSHYRFETG